MCRILLVFLCLLGCLQSAFAGPFRMLGYDSWAAGLANSESSFGGGLGVLYSNPALLVDLDDQVGVSCFFMQPSLKASLMERPLNADIPLTFYDSDVGIEGKNLDRPLPTVELPTPRSNNNVDSSAAYLGIGLAHSLGIDGFRVGLQAQVPTSGLLSLGGLYPDEREQYFTNTAHFTRFGEWDRLISLQFGAAYRPTPWLLIGASVEGALNIGASLDVYIPEASVQDYSLANTKMHTKPSARGIVGLAVRPIKPLSISVVWRDRRYTKVDATAALKLWNYHEAGPEYANATVPKRVQQEHLLALDYEPMEVTMAAGFQWKALTTQLGVTWSDWSNYLDAHHLHPEYTAMWPETYPLDSEKDSRFAFSDTFSFMLGISLAYSEGFTANAGAAYRPSPVPAQVGRTNFADNDVWSLTVGHRLDFELGGKKLRFDIGLQFWHLVDITVNKDPSLIRDEFADRAKTLLGEQPMPEAQGLQTNNPGFPGYSLGGWLLAGSFSLIYLF